MPPKPTKGGSSIRPHLRPASPDEPTHPELGTAAQATTSSDVGTLKAELLSALREDFAATLKTEFQAILGESLSSIKSELLSFKKELSSGLSAMQESFIGLKVTVAEMERSLSTCTDDIVSLQRKVEHLTKAVAKLEDKCDDLESRSRRQNIRIVGVPEDDPLTASTTAISRLLKEAFDLAEELLLDRAHRTLAPKPKTGERPRPIVARLHYYTDCVKILSRARELQRIKVNNMTISVFPDYTAKTARARAAFADCRRQLRGIEGVRFGLLHPARLRIMHDGVTRDFTSPEEAKAYIKTITNDICERVLKSKLTKKFQCVSEGIAKAGNPTLLNQIYTELYITEGGTAEVNDEHEVRQIETAFRKPDGPETTIRQEDIFKASPGRDEPIRTVLTKGVAGIGKTVLTQKYTLEWAEDKANQDIQFIFPFTFRELNVLKEEKFSLVELVHHFFPETKEAGICSFEDFQVVFIFDGLDECRLPLDFHRTKTLTDPRKSTSLDVLLINLIRGYLLPKVHLWITTRPAAANQIPPNYVCRVTEVRGFTDPQKEEYFRKRYRDEEQASRIISHINTSRSLHIMCHIPVFCWITATVLEDVLLKTREGGELPQTLTEMYIHFLVVQAKVKKVKYDGGAETDPHWSPESRKMIESLGKLAFDQLQKGNLIFYESDLTECGIDIRAASVYSGVFTQVFKEERGLYQDKVFCFIHLSVQEFLAALHVHMTFVSCGLNLLEEQQTTSKKFKLFENKGNLKCLHQSAVKKALQSPNGHLDLFLRFLLGLSLPTNQTLLRGLLTQTRSSSHTNNKTVQYIKEKLSGNLSAEKSINLFHCLNELNDRSLVEEIQQSLSSGSLSTDKLSPAQWSALVFILLSSEEHLDVFDLKKYSASEEALLRLLPVVKASKKAL
ncbi:unnamed protein product [Oreochromis niloticus]|nr:unnamed protein product [Mustela putorius furo]